ncbi:MAG TPA: plastocyanin/azurin family copper-binding protein [Actinomycetota bacterium]|nr:plastocyanin/azurin family copper-binding protein [Actinomycetota bacterium]
MGWTIVRCLLAAALVAVVIGVLPADAGVVTRVRVTDYRYRPARVTIDRGTSVRWRNVTQANDHTVTAYSDNWSKDATIGPGQTTGFRFDRRGTYRYYCSLHAHITNDGRCVANPGISTRMCGSVVVV